MVRSGDLNSYVLDKPVDRILVRDIGDEPHRVCTSVALYCLAGRPDVFFAPRAHAYGRAGLCKSGSDCPPDAGPCSGHDRDPSL